MPGGALSVIDALWALLRFMVFQPLAAWWLWAIILLAAGVVVAGRVYRWRQRAAARKAAEPPRCLCCGYNLSGLEMPRCPECGALRGFQVSLTELGLSEDELRALSARKRAESAAGSPILGPAASEGPAQAGMDEGRS